MFWELENINFYLRNPKPQRMGSIKLRLSVMDHEEIEWRKLAPIWGRKSAPRKKRVRRPKGELSGSWVLHEAPVSWIPDWDLAPIGLKERRPGLCLWVASDFQEHLMGRESSVSLSTEGQEGAVCDSRKSRWQHGWRRQWTWRGLPASFQNEGQQSAETDDIWLPSPAKLDCLMTVPPP